jgi:hypothetical protein
VTLLQTVFSPVAVIDRRRIVVPEPRPPAPGGAENTYGMMYDVLEAYYQNNGIFSNVQYGLTTEGIKAEAVRGLRNPAFRCVEFHASKLWPGPLETALPIRTRNEAIQGPIQQVWTWSNWANRKQLAARYLAGLGDLVLKVVTKVRDDAGNDLPISDRRVYFQVIKPRYVTDLVTDERNFVKRIRIDIPQQRRTPDGTKDVVRTELWEEDRGVGGVQIWEHDQGEEAPIEQLGPVLLEQSLESMGIDFIPIVYAPFRDVGENRGANAFVYQLDKIDEINAQVTRLHKIMFRYGRPVWAILSNMVDATRRAMPAPRFEDSPYSGPTAAGTAGLSGAETWLEGEPVLYFPGLSKPELLIPALQYESFLNAIEAMMRELEDDLPELIYYRVIRSFQEASGRALSYMLSPAVDRVIEVRASAEAALVRADQIALTLGRQIGIFGTGIGTFDSADDKSSFAHTFATRPVIPLSEMDIAEAERARTEAFQRKHELGVPKRRLWLEMGYDQDEIAENEQWWAKEQQEDLKNNQALLEMQAEVQADAVAQQAEVQALAASIKPNTSLTVPANPQSPGTPGRGAGRPRGTQQANSQTIARR